MKTDEERMSFANRIIKEYKLNGVRIECFKDELYYMTTEKLIKKFSEMYSKDGALCFNSNVFNGSEHAMLLTDINTEKNKVTIETWGYSITFNLQKVAERYLESLKKPNMESPYPYDGTLRIYGFAGFLISDYYKSLLEKLDYDVKSFI